MKRDVNFSIMIVVLIFIFSMNSCSKERAHVSDFFLPETVDFNYHIRPVLSQNCFVCHGPDNSSRKANLRLDTEDGATMTLANGHRAIVPGSIQNSELIKRLKSQDPNEVMPPPESKKFLTEREIALVEKWIDQGARWKQHWAFIPPSISKSTLSEWASSEVVNTISDKIDFLINEKINQLDLNVSEPGNKHALIRRVAYFVTGLPPTKKELNMYLSNPSENAYEAMVDDYLASKNYGEHWARHWMDLVRYAENMGHEFDYPIGGAHHYRDYLIRAFNDDVPYDQFVKEHLAGDLLNEPRLNREKFYNESILGTAYAFLGEGKHSPVNIKQEEADRIDNMIDVTSKTFQGLTVACAKCHDHKFDPIPTTDYYAMYGMFESSRIGPKNFAYNPERKAMLDKRLVINDKLNKEVKALISLELSKVDADQVQRLKKYIENSIPSITAVPKPNIGAKDFSDWIRDPESSRMADQKMATINKSHKVIRYDENISSSRFFGKGSISSLRSPSFEIQDSFIVVQAAGENATIRIIVDNFQLIQNPLYGNLEQKVNTDHWEEFIFNVSNVTGHKAYIEIMPGSYKGHLYRIGVNDFVDVKSVVSSTTDPRSKEQRSPPLSISNLHNNPLSKIAKSLEKNEPLYNFETLNKWLEFKGGLTINDKIRNLKKDLDNVDSILAETDFVMGMSEGNAIFSPVFIRGSIDELSDDKVPHRFLSAVSQNKDVFVQRGSGRLEWAQAVTDPKNPLSSRVMVNRIWHHLFGKGIVKSVDNFGLQGSLPTHPELLDFLAVQFMDDGWSIKAMIKNILLTDTFKRSTSAKENNEAKDPKNEYYHTYPVRRLNAESIRDGVLAITGSLNDSMYGAPIPIYLTEFMNGRGRPSTSGPLDGKGRRSIYLEIRRNFLSPMMLTFDMPIPFSTFGKRNTTNVPAQSLTLMNDPFIHDQAQKWARRIVGEDHQSIEQRFNEIYLDAFARPIQPKEVDAAMSLIEILREKTKIEKDDMMKDHELWTEYYHVIMNAKEFIHLL